MALNTVNFVPRGPINSADMRQFTDLFTGVMSDQPVTFKNTLTVGGSQGAASAPLKLFGVAGQTGNLIELYPTVGSSNPTFGFGALGNFAWGPGSPAANDTFLSRVGTQNGHVADTAGLLISPYLEVDGLIRSDGYTFANNATLVAPEASPFLLEINQDLKIDRDLIVTRKIAGPIDGGATGLVVETNLPAGNTLLSLAPATGGVSSGVQLYNVNARNTSRGVFYMDATDVTIFSDGTPVLPFRIVVGTTARVFIRDAESADISGLRAYGNLLATSGAGVELGHTGGGGLGYITSYDRSGAAYTDLAIDGKIINITPHAPGNVAIIGPMNVGGNLGINGTLTTTGAASIGASLIVTTTLQMVQGQQMVWGDANSSISSAGQSFYFDNVNAWLFRQSGPGALAVRFSVDATGNTIVTNTLRVDGNLLVFGATTAAAHTDLISFGGSADLSASTNSNLVIRRRFDNVPIVTIQGFGLSTFAGEVRMGTGGVGSSNVASNGVLFSVHGNIYGGIYYSTTSQFIAWPSVGAFKPDAQPINVRDALADPHLRGMQYHRLTPVWSGDRVYKGVPEALSYGFIAEEWATRYPELMVDGPGGIAGFNPLGVIPITWEAVRALYAEVVTLRTRIQALEGANT